MNVDMEKKIILDKIALACFACVFLSIQIVFAIGLIVAYQKVRRLKKREQKFLKQTQNEEEYDPYYWYVFIYIYINLARVEKKTIELKRK